MMSFYTTLDVIEDQLPQLITFSAGDLEFLAYGRNVAMRVEVCAESLTDDQPVIMLCNDEPQDGDADLFYRNEAILVEAGKRLATRLGREVDLNWESADNQSDDILMLRCQVAAQASPSVFKLIEKHGRDGEDCPVLWEGAA